MKKPNRISFGYALLYLCAFFFAGCQSSLKPDSVPEEDGPRESLERDIEMMKDPSLGYVPSQRIIAAKDYKDRQSLMQTNSVLSGVEWKALGPKNQGGRSRTLLVDANDPTGNTVFAGSVGGGLWKTSSINAADPFWAPVNDLFDNLAITSIAQDPSNPLIIYFCTGEGYGNLDGIAGLGIWKTVNGGASWAQLASTNNSSFYYCQKVSVNNSGVLFASTYSGLRRSADGGATFTKVLGTGLGITGVTSDFCYDVEIAANGEVYSSLNGSVHKSTNGGVTFNAAQTLPIVAERIELACAPSNANYVYALCENSSLVAGILQTTDGGATWTSRTEPADADGGIPATDFSRTQAWYDLSIAVDPNNPVTLFVGGVDIFKSIDGAGTWSQVSHWYGGFGFQNVHADQHYILFKSGSSSIAYFSNDGGIYQTTNANAATPTLTDKGAHYITAQFYSCAIHPTAQTPYYLAGAQDNGSHQFSTDGVQNTIHVSGGDGAFCHIDQDQPQYQFTSYVFNDFFRSVDGGATWTEITTTGGRFISPTDYDDLNNRLYMSNGTNNYRRWNNPQTGSTFNSVSVPTFGGQVSAIKVSPNTANRVFFGIGTGKVFMLDNANTATPTATDISTGLPAGYVSCIEVETGNDNHLLALYSNYGINSIWESIDGGTSWTSVEGNLPDMPIRWAVFNPSNSDQVAVATELGVWTTDNLNGGATVWGASNSGLANVRVDMLQIRQSDKFMIAATHGRGLFSSDIFTTPTAKFDADKKTTYKNVPVNFNSTSYKGTTWNWNFGDGNTSIAEKPSHTYSTAGKYNVSLTINSGASSITKNQYIQILPDRGTPYLIANGGSFEVNSNDFGVDQINGTSWELGNSAVAGKDGVHAGANAWVTGLVGDYVDNSESILMTPNYNFLMAGTYSLTFWSKSNTESDFDGFRVEYSLNKGTSWLPVGTTVAANWYNSPNISNTSIFPANEAFFSGNRSAAFTQSVRDISFLSGNVNVAFRIRFKSDEGVTGNGAAIDDFEITGPSNVVLPLTLTSFKAFKNNADVQLIWNTENEENVSNYKIERSNDGIHFVEIGNVNAKNAVQNSYSYPDLISQLNSRPTGYLYYRLKMLDADGTYKYSSIARITLTGNDSTITIGPNPFTDYLLIYSTAEIKKITLFDIGGKQVFSTTSIAGNKVNINKPLSNGTYVVRIETTEGIESRKILKGN